jgi:hypothetical protein
MRIVLDRIKTIGRQFSILYCALCISMVLSGCSKELLPAEVIIIDPVRHYYPVVQGELMGVNFEIENISDNPLFIQEIQTTCGCLVARDELPIVVLPHKRGFIHLDFNTIKNNGYAEHFIYCYGNFKDKDMIELQFDTNVVPQADYFRDYEQLWKEQTKVVETKRTRDDGSYDAKGYYIGDEDEETPSETITPSNNNEDSNTDNQRRGRSRGF